MFRNLSFDLMASLTTENVKTKTTSNNNTTTANPPPIFLPTVNLKITRY